MTITDPDGMPGLRIETAAGVTARDMIAQHLATFGLVIRTDRIAGKSAVAAYVDGLAGAMALAIAGGKQGSKDEAIDATMVALRDAIDRDLRHLRPQ